MGNKTCQNCHGNKTVTVWDGKKYVKRTCPACNGTGVVNPGLV